MAVLSPLSAFIIAAVPYFVPVLLAGLVYVTKKFLDRIPTSARPLVAAVVSTNVAAVEAMAAKQLAGPGKKSMATEMINNELSHLKLKVPPAIISALIEEAWLLLPKSAPKV
jgi:MFS superfamily sulfate permease-like transporter